MIFVFDFGVKGVALASFLAQLSMVAYFIYTLMGLHIGLSIRIALRPFSWKIYRVSLRRHGADADATDHCGRHSDL